MKKLATFSICFLFSTFTFAHILNYACMQGSDTLFFKYFMGENVGELMIDDGNASVEFPNDSSVMSIVPQNDRGLLQLFITSDSPEASVLLEFTPPTFLDFVCKPQFDQFGLPRVLPQGCHQPREPKMVELAVFQGLTVARTSFQCDLSVSL